MVNEMVYKQKSEKGSKESRRSSKSTIIGKK